MPWSPWVRRLRSDGVETVTGSALGELVIVGIPRGALLARTD